MSVRDWSDTVLKSIADGVIATDADACVVFMNRAAEKLTGWDTADASGKPVSEVLQLIDERTGKRECWPIREVLSSGQPVTIPETTLLLTRTGRKLLISDTASPIRDNAGRLTGAVIVFRDVTERRRAEEAVQEQEKRFRALVEASSDIIYRMSADWAEMQPLDGRGLVVSNEVPIRDWIQKNIPEVEHPSVREAIRRAISGKQTFELEHQVFGPQGDIRWTFSRAIPVLNDHGDVVEWLGTATDITERKQAEEQLRRRMSELEAIFDATPVGINVAEDPECRVIRGNRVLADLVGMTPGANVSKSSPEPETVTYAILANGREVEPHELPMQRAAAEGIEIWDQHLEIVRADGSRIDILVNAKPTHDAEGTITGAVGICVDVTDMKAAEERLKDADRRKDEFLAMLAHELRNPLAAVSNAVTVLKMSSAPENVDFAKDVIERQSRQLARLIDDLLDVSRITSGKIRLKRELCDAGTILRNAVEAVQPLVNERMHRLETYFDEGTLPVRADPVRIEQIFVNLLTNAAKYSENGGRIRVSGERQGDSIVVAIEDNGVGIAPEKLPQMFELFAQGERSIARSEGGLGIGLTIVQKLTEMHGGNITAESRGVGKGSTFTVRLPAAARAPLPSGKAQPDTKGEPRGYRILVVDDNEDTARNMARFLKLLGHEVEAAYDGHAAIEVARKTAPEIILLDIGLPGMDGYEVARRLREEPCCKVAVIIAVSGYGQDDDRRRSREAGFDHHLVKPIEFDSLIQLISQSC